MNKDYGETINEAVAQEILDVKQEVFENIEDTKTAFFEDLNFVNQETLKLIRQQMADMRCNFAVVTAESKHQIANIVAEVNQLTESNKTLQEELDVVKSRVSDLQTYRDAVDEIAEMLIVLIKYSKKQEKTKKNILWEWFKTKIKGNNMWWTPENEKILFIVRGLPGAGKSTLAKQLAGEKGVSYSTDDFFMNAGKYQFDPNLLPSAHNWNFSRSVKAIDEGISPIVIDNTNVQAWEAKRYVKYAIDHGYKVEVREPDTPWKFDAKELAKRNKHGVTQAVIEKRLKKWDQDITVDDILNSVDPYDSKGNSSN